MSECSLLKTTYTAKMQKRFEIEIWHDELNKYQVIRGKEEQIVRNKADAKMAQWDGQWEKERNLRTAKKRTKKAENQLQQATSILESRLSSTFLVDWNEIYDNTKFKIKKPKKPKFPQEPSKPITYPKPNKNRIKFKPKYTLLDYIFPKRKQRKQSEKDRLYRKYLSRWETQKKTSEENYQIEIKKYHEEKTKLEKEYSDKLEAWQKKYDQFEKVQNEWNEKVNQLNERFKKGDPEAVTFYYEYVIAQSKYPFEFKKVIECVYQDDSKLLVVNYHLPQLSDLPLLKEVQYIKTRNEFKKKYLSTREKEKYYEDVLFQITLRTIYEVIKNDMFDLIASIAFNGYVESIDSATGKKILPCILSIITSKQQFNEINLLNVIPKACFNKLKGISGTKLVSVTPIAPLIDINQDDSRFVAARNIIDSLDDRENIAAMDWQDFEHLIRELFEKEFQKSGGNIKITRASRDRGVDAIAFDPDPIRGGKIVIQAKRYTNTVGVSAVRDLYGTVVNEGATKGILVTTSDYGPDAYEFASDKPLSLLNGNNLLHLLENHNYMFTINLVEARKILGDE